MTMNDERMKHGAFGWNELMTTDVAAARRFYGALFGWETEDYPVEGMNYVLIKVGGEEVGGMMARLSMATRTDPLLATKIDPLWDHENRQLPSFCFSR
jgi:predicted enzyme related to lactoylglutathione lyase